jgi:hypothetical protein
MAGLTVWNIAADEIMNFLLNFARRIGVKCLDNRMCTVLSLVDSLLLN